MKNSRVELERQLSDKGYTFTYGGGKRSKGHGWWLSRNGRCLLNDGTRSGNPHFFTVADAQALLSGQCQPLLGGLTDDASEVRVKSTGSSSAKYGKCEICGQHASEVFCQRYVYNHAIHHTFGHDECLKHGQPA